MESLGHRRDLVDRGHGFGHNFPVSKSLRAGPGAINPVGRRIASNRERLRLRLAC